MRKKAVLFISSIIFVTYSISFYAEDVKNDVAASKESLESTSQSAMTTTAQSITTAAITTGGVITTQAAVEVEPPEMIAARNGDKAYQEKDYEKAIENYTKAIEISSNSEVFYNNRGLAYYAKKIMKKQ